MLLQMGDIKDNREKTGTDDVYQDKKQYLIQKKDIQCPI
jgi:hypothetical protein